MNHATTFNLEAFLNASPYLAYTYAYPHKTAYRSLEPRISLKEAWALERSEAFLYVHIPFCEMRCGFCNLFTTVNPDTSLAAGFLNALERQAQVVRGALPQQKVARAALGGGTPTYLEPKELERVFTILDLFGVNSATPLSIETSPATATTDRLELLKNYGVDRVSIGIQSFVETEARSVGRAQRTREVVTALERIQAQDFPTLNLDLIYGLPGQTRSSWLESLKTALEFGSQELFLYPLYVRPLTGLGKTKKNGDAAQGSAWDLEWDAVRLELYRVARDFLLENGYAQHSMRVFRRVDSPARAGGMAFDAQADGLIGLGAGARSYTQNLHYSSEYAVGQVGVREIISDYAQRSESDFAFAAHGFYLDPLEQRHRFILQDIFNVAGFSSTAYQKRFSSHPLEDFPVLQALLEHGLLNFSAGQIQLGELGLERSDAIGPLFYSSAVQQLAHEYAWR